MATDLQHSDPLPESGASGRPPKKNYLVPAVIVILLVMGGLAFWKACPSKTVICDPDALGKGQSLDDPDDSLGTQGITFTNGSQDYYFLENQEAGSILVLTGLVRNSYSDRRSFIRLRTALLDKNGCTLVERFIYAGNVLSDEDLKSLPISELTARLNVKGGQEGRNTNIEPGQTIPFMAVFNKLPDDMDEYRIDPVASEPANVEPELAEAIATVEQPEEKQGFHIVGRLENELAEELETIELPEEEQSLHIVDRLENEQLVVISGVARNGFDHRRSFIRLRGHLLAADGRSLAERYVYAGNLVTGEDLKHLPPYEIISRLNIKGGQDGRNMNIEPGREIPFMLVFEKQPAGWVEYRIDLIGSSPAEP